MKILVTGIFAVCVGTLGCQSQRTDKNSMEESVKASSNVYLTATCGGHTDVAGEPNFAMGDLKITTESMKATVLFTSHDPDSFLPKCGNLSIASLKAEVNAHHILNRNGQGGTHSVGLEVGVEVKLGTVLLGVNGKEVGRRPSPNDAPSACPSMTGIKFDGENKEILIRYASSADTSFPHKLTNCSWSFGSADICSAIKKCGAGSCD